MLPTILLDRTRDFIDGPVEMEVINSLWYQGVVPQQTSNVDGVVEAGAHCL